MQQQAAQQGLLSMMLCMETAAYLQVIHRKATAAAAHHRRYSFSVGSPCTPSTARSGGSVHIGAGALARGHSMSADAYLASLGPGGSASGSPFAACATVGGQLQPLYSTNGVYQSSNGGESRPLQHHQLQHAIEAPGSRAASTVGFHSSPGMMQHSGGNLALSSAGGAQHSPRQQLSNDFLLPVDRQPSAVSECDDGLGVREATLTCLEASFSSVVAEPAAAAPSLLNAAGENTGSGDGVVAVISVTGDGRYPEQQLKSATAAADPFATAAAAQVDPSAVPSDESSAAPAAAITLETPSVATVLPSPRHPVHRPHISIDNSNTISRAGSTVAGSFTMGAYSPLPVAAVVADAQTAELMREMAVMKKLDHPHVVALHEVGLACCNP